jgi:esterase/lipase
MKKLSEEELKALKEFQEKNNKIVADLGTIELNINILKGQKDKVLEDFQKLQDEHNVSAKELQDKYGAGNIDLESGEFTPEEKSTSK